MTTKAFEILFGGSRFGGKSEIGRAWLLKPFKDCESGHITWNDLRRYRGLVIRKNFKDLREWKDKTREFYKPTGAQIIGDEIRFPQGPIFWLGHLADRDSYEKYIGWEVHRLLIEELNQIPNEEDYEKLLSCVRSTIGIDPRVMVNTNPGGRGHLWIKKRFKIPNKPPPYDTIKQNTPRGKRVFIPATIDDNPIAKKKDPTYEAFLKNIPSKSLRLAWWKGDWTQFSGQFFDLNDNIHKIEPFEIPTNWQLWAGLDYGETHPTAYGLYAKSGIDDSIYRICEYVRPGPDSSEHARLCMDITKQCKWTQGKLPGFVHAGTDMWVKRTNVRIGDELVKETYKRSPADDFMDYGFNIVPANTDRINGWRKCHKVLRYENAEGDYIEPKFHYFSDSNEQFELCMQAMIHAKTGNTEDMQKQEGDDPADEFRYAMMGEETGDFKLSDYDETSSFDAMLTKGLIDEQF